MTTSQQTSAALNWLEQISNQEKSERDYEQRYWDSTRETLIGLYSKRVNGEPVENVTQIVSRVADSLAVAEARYLFKPEELVQMTLDDVFRNPAVIWWSNCFAECIGQQYFWMNTPGNINSDPEVALKVLQYEAHGKLEGMDLDQIWGGTEYYIECFREFGEVEEQNTLYHQCQMGRLAEDLRGKGCLAACGVTFVEDNLFSIQEAARIEVIAAKNSMGMGINTSSLRPWNSLVSNGAAASGPERFYQKTIASAVEAVAQGGRRGGALIEWRNSNHPDILFFIDKKKLIPEPDFKKILAEVIRDEPDKTKALEQAARKHAELYQKYIERQNYLKNTNVSVLAMPGFMEAVEKKHFYPAVFNGEPWQGHLYDPRKPVLDPKTGMQAVSKLTKEPVFENYTVDLKRYPEAQRHAKALGKKGIPIVLTKEQAVVPGCFYAPDVFDRICEGMRDSGEPGIGFWKHLNDTNANPHHYDLFTTNPCGEQALPTGRSKDGQRVFMGNCNLSSLHAAHQDFWAPDGQYRWEDMEIIAGFQQRAMDNVTDISWYPIPAQNLTARLERRNGGGFAGIAEFLSRSEVRFGSDDACELTRKLFERYNQASLQASLMLALQRGVYPLWEGSRFDKLGLHVRNSCMGNNAPTGTLAQAMQTSWGVDPHNGIVFSRKVRSRYVDFVAPGFADLMQKYGAWPQTEAEQAELMQKIRQNGKSVHGLPEVPREVQNAYPLRVEITPEEYIRHLGACYAGAQECPPVFNSISNTCSIPGDTSLEFVRDAVKLGYHLGVKALTFYPDGSRMSQPVEKIARDKTAQQYDLREMLQIRERRKVDTEETQGTSYKVKVGLPTGQGTLHIALNHARDQKGIIEIYSHLGKSGCLEGGMLEAVCRLSSLFLQYAAQFGEDERAKVEDAIIDQLQGIESGFISYHKFSRKEKPDLISSPVDGLAKALRYHRDKVAPEEHFVTTEQTQQFVEQLNAAIKSSETSSQEQPRGLKCQKCGGFGATKIDGCTVCESCGYSKCG